MVYLYFIITKSDCLPDLFTLLCPYPDTAYLMTSELLVETGMLLVEKDKAGTLMAAGVVTPAVAFGSQLTRRITTEMDVSFDLKDTPIQS